MQLMEVGLSVTVCERLFLPYPSLLLFSFFFLCGFYLVQHNISFDIDQRFRAFATKIEILLCCPYIARHARDLKTQEEVFGFSTGTCSRDQKSLC